MLQATRRTVAPMEEAAEPLWQGQGMRWLANVFFVLGLVALLAGIFALGKQWMVRTHIASVQVEGSFRQVDKQAVVRDLSTAVAGNYFTVSLKDIRDAARGSPWVDDAVVSREWPDVVRVQILEKQAVARWGDKGLISSRGELFAPVMANGTEGLPILFGPADKARYVMEQYRTMNGILRGLGLRLVELQLTDRMSWFLRMDSGLQIVVDQMNPVEKLQRFAYLYQRQLAPDVERIASIDLRYRNGVAVGWKNEKSEKNLKSGV